MRSVRAALAAIVGAALLHAGFFIWYQQPDWQAAWTDQGGYRMLAHGLAASGQFTRYPGTPEFVPEAIRTPGYPLFVAAVYTVAGESQHAVVAAQAVVFALMCLVVYGLARHVASPALSVAAACAVAAYPMFPYFGALTLTELWTTFLLTCGMFCLLRAAASGGAWWFAAAGALLAGTALTRPVFFLLPAFLAVPALVHVGSNAARSRTAARWALFAVVFAAVMAPWFAYNYRHFGQLTLSPAGNLGRPIWEGSWQGQWSGRTQAQLTRIADQAGSDEELRELIHAYAAEANLPPESMLEYTHQWRRIRHIWTTPTDPEARVEARIAADQEYWRVGVENIRRDPADWVRRRLTRGLFVLWAADVPIRYTSIDATPPWIIRSFWALQVALVLLAAYGAVRVWRAGRAISALLLVMPLLYVTAVHLPILCEARQSLPVKPLLLTLAVLGAAGLAARVTSRQTAGS